MSPITECCVRVCLIVLCCFVVFVSAGEENLYKTLGVARSASTQEIKKAYRKKALDTHPDKNKDVPAEVAAEAFQKVVHAFEILSDASSRKRYDQTGRTDGGGSGGRQQGGGGSTRQWSFFYSSQRRKRPKPKLKDRFDVKQSQSRIIHIVSLDQLEVIITTIEDDSGAEDGLVLERNLLLCFYTPSLEKHLMEEMVYPWPFAAMSTQKIWWEDILQATAVRFHLSNELTEFFGIPNGKDLEKPIFLFGKRGQNFRDPGAWNRRLSTDDRRVFDKWVWQQLQQEVTFVNKHDHTVEIYWIHEKTAEFKGYIAANEEVKIISKLSHEWWVRDSRVDKRKDSPNRNRLTDPTCLYSVKITSDTRTHYTIPKRDCYDLSGHCIFWNRRGDECSRNPVFMHEFCAVTCGRCKQHDSNDQGGNETAAGEGETANTKSNGQDGESKSSLGDEL